MNCCTVERQERIKRLMELLAHKGELSSFLCSKIKRATSRTPAWVVKSCEMCCEKAPGKEETNHFIKGMS
eukprot:1152183-Pelagomonas_calceolata.AAC.13